MLPGWIGQGAGDCADCAGWAKLADGLSSLSGNAWFLFQNYTNSLAFVLKMDNGSFSNLQD